MIGFPVLHLKSACGIGPRFSLSASPLVGRMDLDTISPCRAASKGPISGMFNAVDNEDYVTVEVEGNLYQVYRAPDMVPKLSNVRAAKRTKPPRTCFYCRNHGHMIANCPYREPSFEARVAKTHRKNEVPQAPAPPAQIRTTVQQERQEQKAWNNMDDMYLSPPVLTSVLARLNNLKESVKKTNEEIKDLTKLLQPRAANERCNKKRKNVMQGSGHVMSGKLKKPRIAAKGHAFHQLTDMNEGSSSANPPPVVDRKVPRANQKCFSCRKHGHFIADCPEILGQGNKDDNN